MTISFYKGLTRNPEVGNAPVWVIAKEFGVNVENNNNKNNSSINQNDVVVNMKNICLITALLSLTVK